MSGFDYSLNASTIRGTPILQQIQAAAAAGYHGIELWFADLDAALAEGVTLDGVRRSLNESGLRLATMIYLGGWFEAEESEWPWIKVDCTLRLEQAAALGAKYVIASPPEGSADVKLGARRYGELLEAGEVAGVLPAMEFLGFVEELNTIESALEVVESAGYPGGTIVVDPFHIFRGGGSLETLATLRGDQIAIAHFNDAPASPCREVQHDCDRVWPGDGHLDLPRYCALLRQIGYRGWLSVELFREDLWKRDPVEVARLGLEKMRAVVEA